MGNRAIFSVAICTYLYATTTVYVLRCITFVTVKLYLTLLLGITQRANFKVVNVVKETPCSFMFIMLE